MRSMDWSSDVCSSDLQTGTQFEAGVKWQPERNTLVTVTAFHIKERNRVLYLANNVVAQSGELTTKDVEFEASYTLPGNFELLANYGFNQPRSEVNISPAYMQRPEERRDGKECASPC